MPEVYAEAILEAFRPYFIILLVAVIVGVIILVINSYIDNKNIIRLLTEIKVLLDNDHEK